jgi:DNA mismatch repair protein MutS2
MITSEVLEFEALRQLLGRYVHSALGRAELDLVTPTSDRGWIDSTLADTAEALDFVRMAQSPQTPQRGAAICPRFDSIPDPGPSLSLLRIEGASLEARQIYELTQLLDQAGEIRTLLSASAGRFPLLRSPAWRRSRCVPAPGSD